MTSIFLAAFNGSQLGIRLLEGVIIAVALSLIPQSWKNWSDRYVREHRRLLWGIVIVMLSSIPLVLYLLWPK